MHVGRGVRLDKLSDTSWTAGSGAIFDLGSNALRPSGWTSADAAGLPILPGLARYDEVAAGEIAHALRFTAPRSQKALHLASPPPGRVEHEHEPAADGRSLPPQVAA